MQLETFADNLIFPEGSRWKDNKLICSDIFSNEVISFTEAGNKETVVKIDGLPVGLGWNKNDDLLINSLQDKKVLVYDGKSTKEYADIGVHENNFINDMTTDSSGRAYVGTVALESFNENIPIAPDNMPTFSSIMLVDVDGSVRRVADRMTFTNGMAISPDGKKLVVAETFAYRLSIFDIKSNGDLDNRRIFADLGAPTDGITMDVEGRVWVAIPYYKFGGPGGWVRVAEGGEISGKIDSNTHGAFDCVLGGKNMDNLYLLEGSILGKERAKGDGRIRVCNVDSPGFN
ncbi:MAG: hypothetical protein CL762_03355 [Chloroflexi bacterium]|nr:hypothetical protein [Chloroflexota bacterium]|tara:strand:- start:857 stop:1720 length:864 start_codon:yes stop_codon:yes gene_type:complete